MLTADDCVFSDRQAGATVFGDPDFAEARPLHTFVIHIREPRTPEWAPKVLGRLFALLELPPNWDSYGAHPLDLSLVMAACELLVFHATEVTPEPQIVPTNRGGIQIEWHTNQIDLEIEVNSSDVVGVFFEDEATSEEVEGTYPAWGGPLARLISRLSTHSG